MYIQLKIFLPSRRKSLLQHTVDNEVSALARLSFYENLFIGQGTSVRGLYKTGVRIYRKWMNFSQEQRKLSVMTRCPYYAGVSKAWFDCT